MTVATTVLGPLPLLWEPGVGADVSARTAAPVAGGLWSCMFLTLLVLRAAYAIWRRFQFRRRIGEISNQSRFSERQKPSPMSTHLRGYHESADEPDVGCSTKRRRRAISWPILDRIIHPRSGPAAVAIWTKQTPASSGHTDLACSRQTVFGVFQISEQISAADDFGSDGWMLWHPHNRYEGLGLGADGQVKNAASTPH